MTLRFAYFSALEIPSGAFTHVAATFNATTNEINLYINGVLDVTHTAVTPTTNSDALFIGTPQDAVGSSSFAFSGTIDEVRIWNDVRSGIEIDHYQNCELNGEEENLLAYYQFNQGVDRAKKLTINSLTDSLPNSYNGTLVNFALDGNTSNWTNGSSIITGSSCSVLSVDAFFKASYGVEYIFKTFK